ncbi:TonB family protein [Kordiimonas marina]|uniref:TonB family protein n=1 Tax=Kordiimonas marina TaxID=2872312 RepID=UPI001FF46BF1|nr:TonB family protein [Kordiimonas marina]MCJ9430307.1 energy transducer TonB [Kordiimonas marina]
MAYSILKTAKPLAAFAVAALMATSAHAQGTSGLTGWAKDAGKSIDRVMSYPAMAVQHNNEGTARFRVTVDRTGKLLAVSQTVRMDSPTLNGAAKRVINRAKFPALPASYGKDKMTFAVRLQYAIVASQEEALALKRQGHVTGEALASNAEPMVASIEILSDQD